MTKTTYTPTNQLTLDIFLVILVSFHYNVLGFVFVFLLNACSSHFSGHKSNPLQGVYDVHLMRKGSKDRNVPGAKALLLCFSVIVDTVVMFPLFLCLKMAM